MAITVCITDPVISQDASKSVSSRDTESVSSSLAATVNDNILIVSSESGSQLFMF